MVSYLEGLDEKMQSDAVQGETSKTQNLFPVSRVHDVSTAREN